MTGIGEVFPTNSTAVKSGFTVSVFPLPLGFSVRVFEWCSEGGGKLNTCTELSWQAHAITPLLSIEAAVMLWGGVVWGRSYVGTVMGGASGLGNNKPLYSCKSVGEYMGQGYLLFRSYANLE